MTAKAKKNKKKFSWQATLVHIYKFFASIKLAILVLIGLIIVFAAGTIVESFHGTEAAKLLVYQSPWFSVLLFFLGINVIASAVDRLPWKKKHIGFVMTHAGIVIILVGSFITKAFMVDAQMVIPEGETKSHISFTEPVLRVFSSDGVHEWALPLEQKPFPWEGREIIEGVPSMDLALRTYYPKATFKEKLIPSDTGSPAVKLKIQNSFMNESMWLMENDARLGQVAMGPAVFRFTDVMLKAPSQKLKEGSSYLEFQFQKQKARLPISSSTKFPATYELEGTPYRVTVLGSYQKAMIQENQLVEEHQKGDSLPGENPAVVFFLEGEGFKEKHTAFAKFPDFPTMHGMQPSQTGARIFYRLPGTGSQGESHELRFVQKEGKLYYQIQNGFEVTTGEVVKGETVSTGWMDLTFVVEEIYPHAGFERIFSPEENQTEKVGAFPVLQLEVKTQETPQAKSIWLIQGMPEAANISGQSYHFLFGQHQMPLGFKIKLRDFKIKQYPGTNRPASFESDVTLIDDFRGIQEEITISMNEPLDHQGYRIFQASYMKEEGQPEISVFAVVRDPGIWVKYIGTIVMICGIIVMFVAGRFTFKKNQMES